MANKLPLSSWSTDDKIIASIFSTAFGLAAYGGWLEYVEARGKRLHSVGKNTMQPLMTAQLRGR